MSIHVGHHFFGAGNAGDDFMLAGFLAELPPDYTGRITCAVPHDRVALSRKFPRIEWLEYTAKARRAALASADVWLGLGGSPFQSAVSSWFVQHLSEEAEACATLGKRMYFLGVGGQDPAAYAIPTMTAVIAQAERIWTRDAFTAEALASCAGERVQQGADLAHLCLATAGLKVVPGRLTVTLNFDYGSWGRLSEAIAALQRVPARERIWLAQETRALPGGEHALFAALARSDQEPWRQVRAEGETVPQMLQAWPGAEWMLTSRYHATLAAAWAGSRTVVIATNDKLRAAAIETGFPLLTVDDDPSHLPELLAGALPTPRASLQALVVAARQSVAEFFAAI